MFHVLRRPLTAAILLMGICLWSAVPSAGADGNALTLETAIEMAARQNPDILKARAAIEAATGRKLQAESFTDPRLVYEPEEARGLDPGHFGSQKIGASESFELFGKRGLRGRIAGADVEAARQQWRRAGILTTARVRRAYWRVAAQRDIVSRLGSTRDLLRELVDTTRARFEGGSASYADVARAKVESAKLENELSSAHAELENAKSALNLLLGRPGDTPLDPASAMRFVPERRSREEIRVLALRDRPSLVIADLARRKSEDARRLARRSYLPDLDLSGSYQRVRTRGAEGAGVDHDWTGVVALSFPFPGAKRQRGLVREADAERRRALIAKEATEREVLAAIDRAYSRLHAAQEQVRQYEQGILPGTKDAFESGVDGYRSGQIDSLGLLDLYRTYKEAQIGYTRSLLDALTAQADLDVAGEDEGGKP